MDELPPPPYSPPPTTTAVLGDAAYMQPDRLALRGGYMHSSLASGTSEGSNVVPAMAYFEDRQPSIPNAGLHLSMVEHTIIVRPDTNRDDIPFPLPLDKYIARDVTNIDWYTFMNHLLPMPDQTTNEKQNSLKGNQHRSHLEEDSPERRQRIVAVLDEWNEHFFKPRLIHIKADYTTSASTRPASQHQTTLQRSHSILSITSSISSSSLSSVSSIKSKDLEGANIEKLRSALLAFRLDPTKGDSLRQSVRQLRNDFRSQRRDLSKPERKELKKEYKEQCKGIQREVKAVVKEVETARKAERKQRKAERKCRRWENRADVRSIDCTDRAQEKSQWIQEKRVGKTFHDRGQKPGMAEIQAQEAINGIQDREFDPDVVVARAQQTASRACWGARTRSRAACSASSKRG